LISIANTRRTPRRASSGLPAGATERLRADDLERELLELAVAGPGIGSVGVHADIGGKIVDVGGAGQQVGCSFEREAGVGLDQRGELEVPGRVRSIGGGHVD
jgi:hypothetical protein